MPPPLRRRFDARTTSSFFFALRESGDAGDDSGDADRGGGGVDGHISSDDAVHAAVGDGT